MAAWDFPCEKCGQTGWLVKGWCPECRKALYGGSERTQAVKLFEPAPEQMPGQLALDD